MKNKKVLLILLIIPGLAATSYGEEKKWSDVAELSFVKTGGNTDVTTSVFTNTVKYTLNEKSSGTWKVSYLSTETDNETTAKRYSSDLRGDHKVSEKAYGLALASWLKDEFAGLEDRYSVGLGLGYHFLNGPKHIIDGEAGLTYTKEERTDGTDDDYPGGRLFASYGYNFTDKNKFLQTAEYLHDFDDGDNYQVNSETSLIAALNGNLSLKTSYLIRYDNQPTIGKNDTDTSLIVTLVINM